MTTFQIQHTEVLIVGAGISGLLAAFDLRNAGIQTLVVDKGRGVGGRLASRRIGTATFDHGAQFITTRTPRFTSLMKEWESLGLVAEWYRSQNSDHIHWRGTPSMTAIPKHLAKSLDVRLEMKMTSLKKESDQWLAFFENGECITTKVILLTAPVPQSLALLDAGGLILESLIRQELVNIEYEPCLTLMAVLSNDSIIPHPGFIRPETGPIAWIADNKTKGVSVNPAVTIQATPRYSSAHWLDEKEQVARELLAAATPWLGADILEYQVHAWRFARPSKDNDQKFVSIDQHQGLIIAGDAFGGARVEGAALSGWAAADEIITLLKGR